MLQRWIILLFNQFFVVPILLLVCPQALAQAQAQTQTQAPTQDQQPSAKIQGILISADDLFRDSEKEVVELKNHVQIVYKTQHIKADKAVVFLRTKRAELYGNVEIVDAKSSIKGDQVFLDYENNTGIIYNGFVQSGLVRFSGDRLEKIADEEFIVSTADYTACTNCPSTWSFSGSSVRAQLGGYAYIKSAVLRISDVPVFWMPYLVVPLKSDRQTGLLTPGFEQSDTGGFTIVQPFFWAISRSTDATITAKNYEHRGLKGMLEYRYMLNEESSGTLSTALLNDKAFGNDPRLNTFRPTDTKGDPLERWYVRYEHYYAMPDDIVARAQVNLASDLQYPKDFPLETMNYGDSAMENRMSITKNTKDSHASMDVSYYVNMLQSDPRAGNDDAVHRAPELRYASTQKNIGESNFIYFWDVDYVNFTRAGNSYDDMTLSTDGKTKYVSNNCGIIQWSDNRACHRIYDGSYDPTTDLIRTGQRLDFRPSVYYPIQITDGFDVVPIINYR
ncbi:MAG TPA: LPS assembly protein LptD, partial [Bdellovibrio sp.]|nr:LPS assembly protein LptD [Bdellovibrio sp.]